MRATTWMYGCSLDTYSYSLATVLLRNGRYCPGLLGLTPKVSWLRDALGTSRAAAQGLTRGCGAAVRPCQGRGCCAVHSVAHLTMTRYSSLPCGCVVVQTHQVMAGTPHEENIPTMALSTYSGYTR